LLEHFSKPGNKWSKAAAYQRYIQVIRPEYPWYNEVSSRVTRNAIDDLDNAFKHFFRQGEKLGFPKFKKKDIKKILTRALLYGSSLNLSSRAASYALKN
jgi:putative transposase